MHCYAIVLIFVYFNFNAKLLNEGTKSRGCLGIRTFFPAISIKTQLFYALT